MRAFLFSIAVLLFAASHAQNFDSLNRADVEAYINALPKSCANLVSGLSIRKKKVDFKWDQHVLIQCSEVFTSLDWWNEFKKLKTLGLRQVGKTSFDSITIYEMSLIKNKYKNLRINFTIFADKENKVDSLQMYIGTNTDTYCKNEYSSAITFFDIFYLKRLLPFIRFRIYLRPDGEAAYYYLKSPGVYEYDFAYQ